MQEEMPNEHPETGSPNVLRVGRAGLLEVFRLFNALGKPRKVDQVILSFDGSCLHFDLNGMSASAAAAGTWLVQVRVASVMIFKLAKFPPEDDPVVFSLEAGRISIGATFSCSCHVQGVWKAGIQLPLNYNDAMILALKLKYTPEEIQESGLNDVVANAEKKCMTRVSAAASELAPFHVTKEDLRKLVDQCIRESDAFSAM